ncbi:MAG TPA: NAD(P)H-dependent oxidoreductase subunit E [Clostridiaceae bacterium]|jgi:NADH-quinone oxidoreductase subunit E/NADP-reducing hydrogenase subunit HndA|nr:NAD(P)H-dependent oxidoreductase subunit E [Clostridiaceae bacterium]
MAVTFDPNEHKEALSEFAATLDRLRGRRGVLMQALHEAQSRFGHIPPYVQELISDALDIPVSMIYGVITFYARFTLEPTGRCEIGVCLGTACYVKGSARLIEDIEKALGIKPGQTTEDGSFTLTATRCVGACGLAPVVTVNQDVHGRMKREEMKKLLAFLKKEYADMAAEVAQ